MYSEDQYEEFSNKMESKFPEMYDGKYGGFCIDAGWWPIIEALSSQIDSYTKWRNNTRAALKKDNPYNHKVPKAVPQVKVMQIKEKFGGLRFYYEGGDDTVDGMVRMAESWAANTCEECGSPGTSRNTGWIKTLCDKHYAGREEKYAKDNGLEL